MRKQLPDGSKPLRLAGDLYWRMQRAGARDGFEDVQAYVHIALQRYLADWKPGYVGESSSTGG
jgi:hypothetical protein